MEAQTDIQDYLERGKQALAQGQGREAAIAFAHAAQIEPDNPLVHLGLAEANLALGSYGVVQMACHKVQELQPGGGIESSLAQALLDLLDRRYDRALQDLDPVISQDPANAYAHAPDRITMPGWSAHALLAFPMAAALRTASRPQSRSTRLPIAVPQPDRTTWSTRMPAAVPALNAKLCPPGRAQMACSAR